MNEEVLEYPSDLCCSRCKSHHADSLLGYDLHMAKCRPILPKRTNRKGSENE